MILACARDPAGRRKARKCFLCRTAAHAAGLASGGPGFTEQFICSSDGEPRCRTTLVRTFGHTVDPSKRASAGSKVFARDAGVRTGAAAKCGGPRPVKHTVPFP